MISMGIYFFYFTDILVFNPGLDQVKDQVKGKLLQKGKIILPGLLKSMDWIKLYTIMLLVEIGELQAEHE